MSSRTGSSSATSPDSCIPRARPSYHGTGPTASEPRRGRATGVRWSIDGVRAVRRSWAGHGSRAGRVLSERRPRRQHASPHCCPRAQTTGTAAEIARRRRRNRSRIHCASSGAEERPRPPAVAEPSPAIVVRIGMTHRRHLRHDALGAHDPLEFEKVPSPCIGPTGSTRPTAVTVAATSHPAQQPGGRLRFAALIDLDSHLANSRSRDAGLHRTSSGDRHEDLVHVCAIGFAPYLPTRSPRRRQALRSPLLHHQSCVMRTESKGPPHA